jgi:hypothetical protein
MGNKAVEQFLANYALIGERGFDMFAREQSKLLSPGLISVSTDHRGTFSYNGIKAFFEALQDWSQYFAPGPDLRFETVQATPAHALVRMHGDLTLVTPVNGKSVSKAASTTGPKSSTFPATGSSRSSTSN